MYRLTWKFDFVNKPSRQGMWDRASSQPHEQACFVNTEGLLRACIIGEDQTTWEQVVLAECSGQDYRKFEWCALYSTKTNMTQITGMALKDRNNKITVLKDGSTYVEPLSEEEKQFHYEGYGK